MIVKGLDSVYVYSSCPHWIHILKCSCSVSFMKPNMFLKHVFKPLFLKTDFFCKPESVAFWEKIETYCNYFTHQMN